MIRLKPNIPGVLGEIVASIEVPPDGPAERTHRDFAAALAAPGLQLIAEIKRRSPSKGSIREGANPTEIARIYAGHAAAISVLTNARYFGGSLDVLAAVRAAVDVPLLMKDFVVSEAQIAAGRRAGADAVLLMASVLEPESIETLLQKARSLGMEGLVEVHDEVELTEVLEKTSARVVGINNRNLTTLEIDLDNFLRLAPRAAGKVRVCESGLRSRSDVDAIRETADAALIGTTLMSAPDIAAKIEALGW